VRRRFLAYGLPNESWVRHVPTGAGGVLDLLRGLSERLSQRYEWDPAQASVFVLTGKAPLMEPLRAVVRFNDTVPVASRIDMRIDPAMPPREVADYYAAVRQRVLGRNESARHRNLTDKHAHLALVAEQPDSIAWEERLRVWNKSWRKQHPEWVYKRLNMFKRDARVARNRLLAPEYSMEI
jgi:hypothetical protein